MRFDVLLPGSTIFIPGSVDAPSSTVTMLKDESRTILIDPGNLPSIPFLEQALVEKEIEPGQVTDILLTHFHMDHAFNSIFFKNATVHLHESYSTRNYKRFGPIVGQLYTNILNSWKKIEVFENKLLWKTIRVIETPFHSRDHVSFFINTENKGNVFLCGDICPRQINYYEMKKGMHTDQASEIVLHYAKKADLIVFPHDEPISRR
ncbi:MAG: MBL fold metallo-hydrolase [Kosmotogaceae bacterium]